MTNDPTPGRPGDGGLDGRFTHGLIFDVFEVLERHGYRRPDGADETARNLAVGRSLPILLDLVRAFEGIER